MGNTRRARSILRAVSSSATSALTCEIALAGTRVTLEGDAWTREVVVWQREEAVKRLALSGAEPAAAGVR